MKRRSLRGSLRPGAASTPVATSTPHGRTRRIASPTLSGLSPPASIRRTPPGAPSARRQSNTLPEPGLGESTSTTSAGEFAADRERGITRRRTLDHEAHTFSDPSHFRERLGTVRVAPRASRDVTATSTTCSGRSFLNTPTGSTSVGRALSRCRAPRRAAPDAGLGAKTNPTASASSAAASSASSSFVIPQIFTNMMRAR